MRFLAISLFASLFFFTGSVERPLEALCVKVSKANLRYGPSTKHQKTWEVYKFMPFQKLKAIEGWFRIKDVDGDIHWVASSLVTTAYKCAVVKKETVNLRTSPAVKKDNKASWGPAKKYWAFKVISTKGSWYQLEDAVGRKSWAHKDYLWIQ